MADELIPLEPGQRGYYLDKALEPLHDLKPGGFADSAVVVGLFAIFGYLLGFMLTFFLAVPLVNHVEPFAWDGNTNAGWVYLVAGGMWPAAAAVYCAIRALIGGWRG